MRVILQIAVQMLVAKAMFFDFGNFKLDERQMQTRTRYVYSDHSDNQSEQLQNASAKFDMAVHQQNYDLMKNDSK